MKHDLRKWNREVFADITKEKQSLIVKISEINRIDDDTQMDDA